MSRNDLIAELIGAFHIDGFRLLCSAEGLLDLFHPVWEDAR